MKKLPVFRSLREVFSGVTRHFFQLAFAAWPAVLCFIALDLAQDWAISEFSPLTMAEESTIAGDTEAGQKETTRNGVWRSPLVVISTTYMSLNLLVGAVAAVRWHRFVLLGEGGAMARHLRREDVDYIWTTFQLWIMMVLTAGALYVLWILSPVALRVPAVVVCGVAAVAVSTRLTLALPDAAMGNGGSFMGVFEESAGNGFRLSGLFLLIGLLTIIPLAVISVLVAPYNSPLESVLGATGSYVLSVATRSLVSLYVLMLNITAISVAYREIIGLPGAAGEEPAVEPSSA